MNSKTNKPAKRRVAITGIGAITPLGKTFKQTWQNILEGHAPAGNISIFPSTEYPTQIAYEIKEFQNKFPMLSKTEHDYLNRAGCFGISASLEALENAGLTNSDFYDAKRKSVCYGVGIGAPPLDWYMNTLIGGKVGETTSTHAKYYPHTLTNLLTKIFQAKGPNVTVHTACASSGQSLGEAYEMIAYGEADVVLTGGADSMINPIHVAGFCLLGALSKNNANPKSASRPFDSERDGFVLGEGACSLVFEDYESAQKRGAKILAEVCGYGVTESAYRITDLHPEGTGPVEAMQQALDDADVSPDKVGYINAHGTSTQLNDRVEAMAISKVFPAPKCNVEVSSTKSMTGHLISAAGALEFAFCVQSLLDQTLPPSINIVTQDPQCTVKLTPAKPAKKAMTYALSNSVGFGGSNTALLAKGV